MKLAKKQNKRVLIDVGGDWCIWCHRLDDTMKGNKEIVGYVKANYIVVKVNFSEENKNEEVLSKYPKITGYPHLFVLDSTGKLIKSEDTSLLEEGDHHDPKKIMAFLREWALKKTDKKVTDKKKTDKVGG